MLLTRTLCFLVALITSAAAVGWGQPIRTPRLGLQFGGNAAYDQNMGKLDEACTMSGGGICRDRGINRVFDIRAYGAVADAVCNPWSTCTSGTDNGVAIQNAIFEACKAPFGGTVYIPPGKYRIMDSDCTAPETSGCPGGAAWYLQIPCDKVTIEGEGAGVSILIADDNAVTFGSVVRAPHMFFIVGGCKPTEDCRTTSWLQTQMVDVAGHTLATAIQGQNQVTLGTVGEAANYAFNDWVFIRTGETIPFTTTLNPDSEVNQVVSSDPATGIITLRWPLYTSYVQERYCQASDCRAAGIPCDCCSGAGTLDVTTAGTCIATATDGFVEDGGTAPDSAACTALERGPAGDVNPKYGCCTAASAGCASGTLAPFTIAKVSDRIIENITLRNFSVWQNGDASGGYCAGLRQVAHTRFDGMECLGRTSGFVGGLEWRDVSMDNSRILLNTHTQSAGYLLAPSIGSTDTRITNSEFTNLDQVRSREIHSHEAVKGLLVYNSRINGIVTANPQLISFTGRAYDHRFIGNTINCMATTAALGDSCMFVQDDIDGGIVIHDNIWTAPPNVTTGTFISLRGDSVSINGNIFLGNRTITSVSNRGQFTSPEEVIQACLSDDPLLGATILEANEGPLVSLGRLPAHAYITEVGLDLVTVFNPGTSAVLDIGWVGATGAISNDNNVFTGAPTGMRIRNSVDATTANAPAAGTAVAALPLKNATERDVYAQVVMAGTAPTTGSACVWVKFHRTQAAPL